MSDLPEWASKPECVREYRLLLARFRAMPDEWVLGPDWMRGNRGDIGNSAALRAAAERIQNNHTRCEL